MLLLLKLLLVLLLGKLPMILRKLPLVRSRHRLLLGPLVRGGQHILLLHLLLPMWAGIGRLLRVHRLALGVHGCIALLHVLQGGDHPLHWLLHGALAVPGELL